MPYDMDPAQSGPLRSASARSQSWFVAIAVIYLLSLELSYFFPDSRQALMVVWPAAGIGLGAFLLCPQSQWPRLAVLLFLTGNLANVIEQRPLLASIGFMTANVLESMGCAALFLWFGAFRVSFAHVREVILLLVGAVCVNAVTALLGATVAYVVTGAGLVEAWKTWWIADGLGILVVTPCFVACIHCIGRGLHESKIRMAEYAGFLVVWLALGWTTFHLSPLSSFFSPPAYILVAMLAWPAFRFGVLGTSVALVLLAVLTITGTQLTFETEFAHTSLNLRRLMEAQEFVAVVTIAGLLLSASHAEARSFAKNAVNEQARLRSLGDNLHNGVIYQEVRELDGTMRFLHVSAGLMRMNGISPEAALRDASAMYTLVLPEDRARLAIAEDASLQSMSVLDIAIRIRRPDGEVRWMQVTSTPRRLRDGRILWDGIQVDITEQKQLETEVLVSKERLQDVLENSLTASYKRNLITDSYDYLSPVAAQLTGYPLEELNGLSYTQILERVHPDDRPSISDAVVSALAGTGQSEHQLEFRMLHKLGEYRWFHDQFTILRDCDGVPTALIGSIGDITDRKCLESALQMSEANLKAIFNASDDSIFLLSPGATVLAANDVGLQRMGLSADEALGRNLFEFMPYDVGMRRRPYLDAVFLSGESIRFEDERNGRMYSNYLRPILGGDGFVARLAVFSRDITERAHGEAVRDEALERLSLIASRVPGVVYQFRMYPDGRSCFPFASETIQEIYQVTPEEVREDASTVFTRIHPDDYASVVDSIATSAAQLTPWQHEFRVRFEDGAVRTLEGNSIPQAEADGSILWHGFITDVTERKRIELDKERLEAQNRQLQKAESLGRLAGAIAHHFNNQLQVVLGNLDLAIGDVTPGSDVSEMLCEANSAARRASELSGRMLTYLGQSQGKRELIDLAANCRQNLSMLQALIPQNVTFVQELVSPGPVVDAVPNQAEQVLTNLVTNAWEAGGSSACTVRVCVRLAPADEIAIVGRFPIDYSSRHGWYGCIEVADTGCGIAVENVESIFDPFFSTKFTGRGMGLATVLGIVRAHDGVITVESQLGMGSTFCVYLPISQVSLAVEKEAPIDLAPIDRSTVVLVVEDEELVRKLAHTMLTRMGFSVLAAGNGMEAITLFRKNVGVVRCVLCDLTMPLMDGWATLSALREISSRTPVVFASGYSEEEALQGEHVDLPQAFIRKPYNREQLRETIQRVIAAQVN